MFAQLLPVVLVDNQLPLLTLLVLLYYLFESCATDALEERRVDDLGKHSVGLHHDLIVQSLVAVGFQQELLAPALALTGYSAAVLLLLQATLNHHHDFLAAVDGFLEDWIVGFECCNLHCVNDAVRLGLTHLRQHRVLIERPFYEILERHFVNLIAKHPAEGVSSKHQASDFVFGFDRELPDSIVVEGLLTEGISLVELTGELVAFVDCSRPILDDVEGRTRITFLNDGLVLVVLLVDERRSDDILLLVGEVEKEADSVQTLPVFFVLPRNDLFNGLTECLSVDDPQMAGFGGPDR